MEKVLSKKVRWRRLLNIKLFETADETSSFLHCLDAALQGFNFEKGLVRKQQ